jgi:hypothetical protein
MESNPLFPYVGEEKARTIFAWKEGFSLEHLGEDTASAPNVHRNVILLPSQHDLWRAVITRRDVSGHLWILNTRQSKIADLCQVTRQNSFTELSVAGMYLEITVFIDENVAGFLADI